MLLPRERRNLRVATTVLGASPLLHLVFAVLGLDAVSLLANLAWVYFAPIWALWLGTDLLRKLVA